MPAANKSETQRPDRGHLYVIRYERGDDQRYLVTRGPVRLSRLRDYYRSKISLVHSFVVTPELDRALIDRQVRYGCFVVFEEDEFSDTAGICLLYPSDHPGCDFFQSDRDPTTNRILWLKPMDPSVEDEPIINDRYVDLTQEPSGDLEVLYGDQATAEQPIGTWSGDSFTLNREMARKLYLDDNLQTELPPEPDRERVVILVPSDLKPDQELVAFEEIEGTIHQTTVPVETSRRFGIDIGCLSSEPVDRASFQSQCQEHLNRGGVFLRINTTIPIKISHLRWFLDRQNHSC